MVILIGGITTNSYSDELVCDYRLNDNIINIQYGGSKITIFGQKNKLIYFPISNIVTKWIKIETFYFRGFNEF